jgi:hypothetical protein
MENDLAWGAEEIIVPIWVSADGKEFYDAKEIETEHLENICSYIPQRIDELEWLYKKKIKELKEKRKLFIRELKRRSKDA